MAYTALSFVFGETPSASKWNLLPANDAAFNSGGGVLGSGLATNAITLGYAEITTNFTSTTTPTDVDVTGIAVTVTVPAGGRGVKITVLPQCVASTAAGGTAIDLKIKEGATTLATSSIQELTSGMNNPIICIAMLTGAKTPSAGSHTYKATIAQGAAGTMTFAGSSSTAPGFILVELL